MPAIVLEGIDESGKTTAAKFLCENFPHFQYAHSPVKETGWRDDYNHYVMDFAWDDDVWVLDRSPEVSEAAYSTVRGEENLGAEDLVKVFQEWGTTATQSAPMGRVIVIICKGYPLKEEHIMADGKVMQPDQEEELHKWYRGFYLLRVIHLYKTRFFTIGYDKHPKPYFLMRLETETLLLDWLRQNDPKHIDQYNYRPHETSFLNPSYDNYIKIEEERNGHAN